MNTTPYVYSWQNKDTLMWYVGVRWASGCYPDDGYICSSAYLKPIIKANPIGWERKIIATGSASAMINLEEFILSSFNAKNEPLSYNRSNGGMNIARLGNPAHNKGKAMAAEQKRLLSEINLGKRMPDAVKKQISAKLKGRKQTAEHIAKRCGPKSEEFLNKIRKPRKKLTCPHCGLTGGSNGLHRYHFNNCKTL